MKQLGKLICVLGSLAAILYVPYNVLGQTYWNFIWTDVVAAFGKGVPVYEHINYTYLLGELAIINLSGLLLMKLK